MRVRVGVAAKMALLLLVLTAGSPGQGPTSARTEYIRTGDRLVATISVPAQVFVDTVFSTPTYSPFIDVSDYMYNRGITSGCQASPPQYCPDYNLTRQAMAVFIIRAWSLRMWGDINAFRTQAPWSSTPHFADVPDDTGGNPNNPAPLFPYIQKMWELGLTSGCTVQNFCPAYDATGYHVSVFSVRARNAAEKGCASPTNGSNISCAQTLPASYTYPSSPYFVDIPPGNGYFQWAQLATKFNAISPSRAVPSCAGGIGYACFDDPVKRAQMSAHVVRVILSETGF